MAAGGAHQGDGGSRAGTQLEQGGQRQTVRGGVAGRPHQVDDVFLDRRRDPDRGGQGAELDHIRRTEERRLFAGPCVGVGTGGVGDAGQLEHGQLGGAVGVADDQLHQEPVELGLGERVGSLVLDRVLGRQHPEGLGQDDGLVADGDLTLLHRLEQGALDLGRRTVDLVGQEDAGDDRTGADVERPGGGPVDLGAGQVGGKQVGGELDPAEREVEGLGQGPHRSGLGEAGHAFDQNVAAGQERDHQPFEQGPLADDQGLHPLDEPDQSLLGRTDGVEGMLAIVERIVGDRR